MRTTQWMLTRAGPYQRCCTLRPGLCRFASSRFCRPLQAMEPEGPARVHLLCDVGLLSCVRAVHSTVTSWSCAVCALSNWPKDPMLLEDLAWKSAGLCSAPRVRGPRSKSMSCLCRSVWRLAERPCPNRFGLCAQRRAKGPCSCAQLV